MTGECLRCGACCRIFGIIEADEYIPKEFVMDEGLGYPTMKIRDDGTCVCLQWEDLHTKCTIYENRPTICKRLKPGSYWCRYARLIEQYGRA